MLVLVVIVLAASVIVALGSLQRLDPDQRRVTAAASPHGIDTIAMLRNRTIDHLAPLQQHLSATLLEARVEALIASRVDAADRMGFRLDAVLAGAGAAADRVECDGVAADCTDGSSADLVDADGTYAGLVCTRTRTRCIDDRPYDGRSDGLVRQADGDIVVALVRVAVSQDGLSFVEALALEPS